MYQAGLMVLALLFLFVSAYAWQVRKRCERLLRRIAQVQRRESDVLQAARVLTAASRESTRTVLVALDQALRVLDPSLDTVLVFVPEGEELACVYAACPRADHLEGMRLRRDQSPQLPARAASCGHRVELDRDARPLIPTDRGALAMPMLLGDALAAVVYVSSGAAPIANPDVLASGVAQAASPFVVAAEREADRRSATFDALTGLHTPRAFRTRLQEQVALAQLDPSASLSLWFIDTDHFKRVNDEFGHAAGDLVLKTIAGLLRAHTIAGIDLPARNGGDEFCAIIAGVHKVAAIERAQRLCRAVCAHDFEVGVRISASVGVAAYPYDASSASELLEVADAAMYHSKRAGRNRVSFALEHGCFAVYT